MSVGPTVSPLVGGSVCWSHFAFWVLTGGFSITAPAQMFSWPISSMPGPNVTCIALYPVELISLEREKFHLIFTIAHFLFCLAENGKSYLFMFRQDFLNWRKLHGVAISRTMCITHLRGPKHLNSASNMETNLPFLITAFCTEDLVTDIWQSTIYEICITHLQVRISKVQERLLLE